ncbi:UDP-3-O-(3-hydroxymyristoyl)glucosamine N-acyltransferase [Leptospirillum ferrooxidans]|uniref:UDP-3-O-acylglucosamine N-acyltransferase n=1 Tax=Leptospirillum ferrooxidans (strain C2-3) TaxID=1162668 RepID=I0IPD6_LEPFC|nr:UDP-3-O-(3-hydroxymyristoyl)glucosamine N-acyltransferase [Leptospirillum ferrooxidans]BAM07135.1 putative UDP-3-O-[3-hydroxymyristoyl] glucosamine N-acyltransferase [Leptospirillum ferrooxidans C2-3]
MTLSEICSLVSGELFAPVGSESQSIRGIRSMSEAREGDITFLANVRYRPELKRLKASAVLLSQHEPDATIAQIVVRDPYLALSILMQHFYPMPKGSGQISPMAFVSPTARIGSGVDIGPMCVVSEGVTIGEGSVLTSGIHVGKNTTLGNDVYIHPNVVIREDCRIGNRVIIQPGAVIGSDGFGYAVDPSGKRFRIPQVGIVVIGDDVEIGANSTVDRATFGETNIGRGTKMDNLVQIAHNVKIGQDCVLVAQSAVAGSGRLGDRVILAGQAAVVGHIEVGSDSVIGGQSGVASSLSEGSRVSGSPAIPHNIWLRVQSIVKDLPSILARIRKLERLFRSSETAVSGNEIQEGGTEKNG